MFQSDCKKNRVIVKVVLMYYILCYEPLNAIIFQRSQLQSE